MENLEYKFGTFFWRITASHMITYMLMGIIASTLLDYDELFSNTLISCFFRPMDSPWIPAGPALQIIRGLIFSMALWYFKENFLHTNYGWLKLWGLLIGLSILSTTGPPPGSIEGFIYTKIPVADQAKGYLEVVPQTGFFALLVCYWYKNPKRIWNIISTVLVVLIILMSLMGVLATLGKLQVS
jgi:hypothetical protein